VKTLEQHQNADQSPKSSMGALKKKTNGKERRKRLQEHCHRSENLRSCETDVKKSSTLDQAGKNAETGDQSEAHDR